MINSFCQKSSIDPTTIYFLSNGNIISPVQTIECQMGEIDKQNKKLNVLVYLIEQENITTKVFAQSKDIVCPVCKEPCKIKIKNFKIKLYSCINKHKTNDIEIKNFTNTQKINTYIYILKNQII